MGRPKSISPTKTVIVIAPHPDDAEIGMGGTIASLSRSGVRVVVLDLSDGEPTPYGSPAIRKRETAKATSILEIRDRILLGERNREIFDTPEARKKVAGIIRRFRPAVIFAPYWEDAHPDHVEASKLVDAARFYSKFVKSDLPHEPCYPRRVYYYFSTHLRPKITPSFIVDVSETFDVKMRAIKAYSSQFVKHPGNARRLKEIENEAAFWGTQIYTSYGEPFVSREVVGVRESSLVLEL